MIKQETINTIKQQETQGHATAQYYLGLMYELGQGVTQDNKKAVYCWQQASENGHRHLKYELEYLGIK